MNTAAQNPPGERPAEGTPADPPTHPTSPAPAEHVVVRHGPKLSELPLERVAWFTSEHRLTHVCEKDGTLHMVDLTLNQLEARLDPGRFFRLNRRFIAQGDAIAGIRPAGRGRQYVKLSPPPDVDVIVSHERIPVLRAWLAGR